MKGLAVTRRLERMPTRLCLGERPAAVGAGAEDGSCRLVFCVEVSSSAVRFWPAACEELLERLAGVLAGVRLRAKSGALASFELSKLKFLAFLLDSEQNWTGSMFSVSTSSKSAGA